MVHGRRYVALRSDAGRVRLYCVQVRQSAKINYTDPDNATSNSDDVKEAVLADVTFVSPPPFKPEEFFIVMSDGNFFFCAPLPPSSYDGKQVWRIGTGIPVGIPPPSPPTEYLQKLIDAYGPGAIPPSKLSDRISLQIKETVWSTRFRTHSAIADTPFLRLGDGKGGPVVLIGDAVSCTRLLLMLGRCAHTR